MLTNKFSKGYKRDIYYVLLFGFISSILGLIELNLPNAKYSATDLREIGIIIGIFYIKRPILTIGLAIISCLSLITNENAYFSSTVGHIITVVISAYFFNYLKKKITDAYKIGFAWFVFVFVYYILLLIPTMIFSFMIFRSDLGFFNQGNEGYFFKQYKIIVKGFFIELIFTSLVTSLFLIQRIFYKTVKKQNINLESLVHKRTLELKRKNAILDKSLKRLKKTQYLLVQNEKMASIGTLTAGVAHEINNPLNYIMGGYIGLKEYFDNHENIKNEDTEQFLYFINEGINKASAIVQTLNLFSSSNESKTEKFDINTILDNCISLLKLEHKKNILVIKNYEKKELFIIGNVAKIHQVFFNILSNSIHSFSDNEGKLCVTTSSYKNKIEIEIKDNGQGIKADILNKITDPFFTTKSPGEGTGLGLSTSYAIIKEHDGSLHIQSEEGKGTNVTITLPAFL